MRFLNNYSGKSQSASEDHPASESCDMFIKNLHLRVHGRPSESRSLGTEPGKKITTWFLTRSPSNFHVHRSLRPTSLLYCNARQMHAWHQQAHVSLPFFKSLPRLPDSAAFRTHSQHICIPVVLPHQTHFLCKPCTGPTLGHSLCI